MIFEDVNDPGEVEVPFRRLTVPSLRAKRSNPFALSDWLGSSMDCFVSLGFAALIRSGLGIGDRSH